MQHIMINGIKTQHLSIMDRGLHYGDGLFETIACTDNTLQFWGAHINRLKQGAETLNIEFPGEEKYFQDIKALINLSANNNCIIKLLLTRGSGERGYRYPQTPRPTRVVIVSDYPNSNKEQGIKSCFCKHTVSINPDLAGIKHLNRLDNVMARGEWGDEFQEGFMFDANGWLIEGTMSNIFGIKDNVLHTPKLDQCGVNGIIREQVLSIAKQENIGVRVQAINIDNINTMDEIFITNSIIGIQPVSSIGEKQFPVGDMTRKLDAKLQQRIKENAKAIT